MRNRAVRSFCVERLICKMMTLYSAARDISQSREIARFYCIFSEPNIGNSEVGIMFSTEKWIRLLFRDIDTPTYTEKTIVDDQTLFKAFGVYLPAGVSCMHLSHQIEDYGKTYLFLAVYTPCGLMLPLNDPPLKTWHRTCAK